ncbi:hypothetical protein EZS27_010110 [termite gut metagenome]|uniref:Uncharacterized protein n=1 Tax=termite gut metagenome TaxID=433724 RepID=A0A5J4S9K4_9ZZZZ
MTGMLLQGRDFYCNRIHATFLLLPIAYVFATFPKGILQASSGIYVRLGSGHGSDMNRRGIGHESDRTVNQSVRSWFSVVFNRDTLIKCWN